MKLQLTQLFKQPGKYGTQLKLAHAFRLYAQNQYGEFEDQIPDWVKGATKISSPWSPDEDPFLVKFDMPAKPLLWIDDLVTKAVRGQEIKEDMWGEALGAVHPFIGAIAVTIGGATDSIYDPFRKRMLRKTNMIEIKGAAKDMYDYGKELFGEEKINNLIKFFDGEIEKTEKGYIYKVPETHAYIMQMFPPITNIYNYYNKFGKENKAFPKEELNKQLKFISSIIGIRGVSVDELKNNLSDLYILQKEYNEILKEDEKFWKEEKTEKQRQEYKKIPKRTILPKRKQSKQHI